MVDKEKRTEFRGEDIYGDIYAQTVIRQGYMKEVEIWFDNFGKKECLRLQNRLAIEKTIKELQEILKVWELQESKQSSKGDKK